MAAGAERPLRPDVSLLAPEARDPEEARLDGALEDDLDAAAAVFALAELPLLDLADVPVFGLAELLVFGSSELLVFDFAEERVLLLAGLGVAISMHLFSLLTRVYPRPYNR